MCQIRYISFNRSDNNVVQVHIPLISGGTRKLVEIPITESTSLRDAFSIKDFINNLDSFICTDLELEPDEILSTKKSAVLDPDAPLFRDMGSAKQS